LFIAAVTKQAPILEGVLDHRREARFLEAMAAEKYQPELLFPKDAAVVGRIRSHPALTRLFQKGLKLGCAL
jgi:hypothetical protein